MRIKKIPAGSKLIQLENRCDKPAMVYSNKEFLLSIPPGKFQIIEALTFLVGFPMEHFPEMDIYSNQKIKVQYR